MWHPEYDGHCTRYWHHRTGTNPLQPDIQTRYHGNYELGLLYHSTTETAALHPQLNTDLQFPVYPTYCITRNASTPVPSDRHCQILLLSPFISPVITPEQANPCWCLYLKRMHREKSSTPGDFTTTLSVYRPLSPLSECWQLFRLLCSSHNPTFLPLLVFTRLPFKTRYGWVLLVWFLHFTIANCNLNGPANLINLYATTVNMKFHGILLLSFFLGGVGFFFLSFFFSPKNDQTK